MKTIICILLPALLSASTHGQTILFEELFDDGDFSSRGWYDNTAITSTTAEHIEGSIASAEYHWLEDETNPTSGGAMRKLFTPSDSVYVSMWLKYSANYTGSNEEYHPHEFHILTTEDSQWVGPAFTHLTAYIEHNEGTPLLALQDGENIDQGNINVDLSAITENRATCGCNGVSAAEQTTSVSCYNAGGGTYWNGRVWKADQVYFSDDEGPYYKNDWHHVEAYFQLNTISDGIGNPDGVIRYWYDGEEIISRTNVILRTGQHPAMHFNQFMIAPYIGDGSPVDQSFWVDDMTVATALLPASVHNNDAMHPALKVYPNPSSGKLTIETRTTEKGVIEIYTALGEKVFQCAIHSEKTDISIDVPAGVYFYNVECEGQLIGMGKVVIR